MEREEAARILDPETSAKVLREYGDGNAQIAACDEAYRIAVAELRRTRAIPGNPLALWELEDMEGQKVLLYRMKSAYPLEPGTVKKHGDVLGDAGMLAYHELYLETWVAFSYQEQEKPDFGKPLTLEQLRGMDGQPVLIEHIGDDSPKNNEWALVFCKEKLCRTSCGNIAIFAFYGIGWLAYAYPPAHIDREAWGPCGNCKPSCANCISVSEYEDDCPIECQCCVNHNNYRPKDKYCSACGRPLTKESWAELEKRLRG